MPTDTPPPWPGWSRRATLPTLSRPGHDDAQRAITEEPGQRRSQIFQPAGQQGHRRHERHGEEGKKSPERMNAPTDARRSGARQRGGPQGRSSRSRCRRGPQRPRGIERRSQPMRPAGRPETRSETRVGARCVAAPTAFTAAFKMSWPSRLFSKIGRFVAVAAVEMRAMTSVK